MTIKRVTTSNTSIFNNLVEFSINSRLLYKLLLVLCLVLLFESNLFVKGVNADTETGLSKNEILLKNIESLSDSDLTKNIKKLKHSDEDDDDSDDDKDDHLKIGDEHHGKGKKKKEHHLSSKEDDDEDHKHAASLGFVHAFIASISVILVSEIGDKTFFIAAIMAMKHPRLIIYTGAMFALGLMTLLSALLGNIVTVVLPRSYTYYASSFLFAIFGIKMLREGWNMSKDEDTDEEYQEAQESLRKTEEMDGVQEKDIELGNVNSTATNSEAKSKDSKTDNITRSIITKLRKYMSPIFLQSFILTFLAEWGDRSQISTIILGAREDVAGTIIGGTLGHAVCTGMAVIGGRFIAQRISVRTVTLCGAFVFLFFAFSAFFISPTDD